MMLDKKTLEIWRIASTDETRAFLHGLHYDHKARTLSATDGRRAVSFEVVEGPAGPDKQSGIIPADVVKEAARYMKKQKLPAVEISLPGDGKVRITGDGRSWPLTEGRYPDLDNVTPKPDPRAVAVSLNPYYLASFARAAGFSEKDEPKIVLYFKLSRDGRNAEGSPLSIEIPDGGRHIARAVLMPCRFDRSVDWDYAPDNKATHAAALVENEKRTEVPNEANT